MVDEQQVRAQTVTRAPQFVGLAGAHEVAGIRSIDTRSDGSSHVGTGGAGQFLELGQRLIGVTTLDLGLQQ